VSLNTVSAAMIVSAITAARLIAGAMGFPSETDVFHAPPLPGFEDFILSPALTLELPALNLQATPDAMTDEHVTSADWFNAIPQDFPHPSSVRERLWESEGPASIDPEVRISTLKIALGGMTALLGLALLALVVSFFTMRESSEAGPPVYRPHS